MALRDIFKISRKTFFYPSAWLDINRIRDDNKAILDSTRDLFIVPPDPTVKETFAEAQARLGLTEEDIVATQNTYLNYAVVLATFGVMVAFFSFYLLFIHYSFSGWLLGISAAALFFGQAFRFHFWYFQIKQRKLGVTFNEWRQSTFKMGKDA